MGGGILSRCMVNLFPLGQILPVLSSARFYAVISGTSLGTAVWTGRVMRGRETKSRGLPIHFMK